MVKKDDPSGGRDLPHPHVCTRAARWCCTCEQRLSKAAKTRCANPACMDFCCRNCLNKSPGGKSLCEHCDNRNDSQKSQVDKDHRRRLEAGTNNHFNDNAPLCCSCSKCLTDGHRTRCSNRACMDYCCAECLVRDPSGNSLCAHCDTRRMARAHRSLMHKPTSGDEHQCGQRPVLNINVWLGSPRQPWT